MKFNLQNFMCLTSLTHNLSNHQQQETKSKIRIGYIQQLLECICSRIHYGHSRYSLQKAPRRAGRLLAREQSCSRAQKSHNCVSFATAQCTAPCHHTMSKTTKSATSFIHINLLLKDKCPTISGLKI